MKNLESEILRLQRQVVRLTKENQWKQKAAFSAFHQKGTTQVIKKSIETIVYNKVQLNIGGGYNESSGVFKVPVGGIYAFFFGIQVEPGKRMAVHFTWNGNPYLEAMAGKMSDYSTGSNMLIINAKKDDCMWIQTHPHWYNLEKTYIRYDPNYFSGFLLYET
ncbi:complement C1q tumor necrosis factor-related protein 7-like [Saccostrea echinata]|uniref:complement C1q tumor necrosis factor-related protein 7-like n=1 Tax=Saccostrea echinata TaxID=191078 RepID=UPI002A7EB30C|nr:complement C1q tumor necrosis factor-related protein 7-like [Saccostrea echinata]